MSLLTHLECSGCGKKLEADHLWNLCPVCDRPLFARYDLAEAARLLHKKRFAGRESTLWRYRELLPVRNPESFLTLGEGFTPLIKADRLGEEVEFGNLYIKDEGVNPTGSFKARGLAVALSRARELGVQEVTIPSAGNAAGATAAYAALGRMKAYVFMPEDVPQPFIAECRVLGAEITLVDGFITDCGKLAADGGKAYGWFDVSTLKEPYRLEGKKTMGYELAEQLNWNLPDVIIYPTGGGTGLIGMWKAFDEMERLEWIGPKRPRMVSVQADGCAPLVKAFHANKEHADFWKDARTIAAGLRVPAAVGDFLILKLLRESQGTAISVPDPVMLEAANLIGRTQGIFVSPESGATLAAFKQLRRKKWINDHEKVILFNTGSGYKYSHLWH